MKLLLTMSLLLAGSFAPARTPAELDSLPRNQAGLDTRYGYELLSNTALYLGPKGKVGRFAKSNMSCTNCHLEGGSKLNGNSWLNTHPSYPQFKHREGYVQTLSERINVCLENNSASRPIKENSREMKSMLLYFRWLAFGQPVRGADVDDRLAKLEFLNRAADKKAGQIVFEKRCAVCHGLDGQGRLNPDSVGYQYPPLWGKNSFVSGSSSSRLSILARFVKTNMPYEKLGDQADLTDEQAWDVSAYVLSKPREKIKESRIYPDVKQKPFDFPFGPYADSFPEEQHRVGPFGPIVEFWKSKEPTAATDSPGI